MAATILRRAARQVLESERAKRWMRPAFHAWQDLQSPGLLTRNAILRGRHAGERVFVLGTGASLRDIDVARLRGERLFGTGHLHSPELDVNIQNGRRGLAHQERWPRDLRLDYYAAVDPVWEATSAPEEVQFFVDYWRSAATTFADPSTTFFANGSDVAFFQRHGLLEGRALYFVKSAGPTVPGIPLRHDLTRRMHFIDGSVYFMIAAAIFLGFTEIYLCGCDYTFSPCRSGHYYDNFELRENRPVDVRHALLNAHAQAHGVRIFNVVPEEFTSPVYAPVSWADVTRQLEGRR